MGKNVNITGSCAVQAKHDCWHLKVMRNTFLYTILRTALLQTLYVKQELVFVVCTFRYCYFRHVSVIFTEEPEPIATGCSIQLLLKI